MNELILFVPHEMMLHRRKMLQQAPISFDILSLSIGMSHMAFMSCMHGPIPCQIRTTMVVLVVLFYHCGTTVTGPKCCPSINQTSQLGACIQY